MNVAAAFDAMAATDPDRRAVHAEGRWWTRGELVAASVRVARSLRDEESVELGDRVGYLGHNRVEELVLLFALARLGAVFAPFNTRLVASELAVLVAHAEPRTLIADEAHAALAAAALDGSAVALRSLDAPTGQALDDASLVPLDADLPLLLAYTSGTSGAPKGAVHTHATLLANARASIAAHGLRPDDRVLTVLPLFHVGGLCIQTLPALLAGAEVVLHPRFDAAAWLAAIASMRPTTTLMVPATLRAAIAHPDWHDTDLSCLRVLMAGSSVIPRSLIDAVHARGVPLGQIYGSTETGPVTVALRAEDATRKAGCAGWPCFADSVRLVPADAVGEIHVRAPNVMRGYWREPASTGFVDGWFATGDLGRFDADGCLEVVGRSRDLIITGGENVHPAEIEDVLATIDGVAEAAVIGVADERWGEVPVAFVVRTPGSMLDDATIARAFDGRLGRYKHPKRIVFVDALPRNAMGKVRTQVLRELLSTGSASLDLAAAAFTNAGSALRGT